MQQPTPVSMGSTPIRSREIILLLMGAGVALFMLDLPVIGVVLGWLGVLVLAYSQVAGPRQSLAISSVVGAAAFMMTFWWPEGKWVWLAVPLLWAGILIMVGAAIMFVLSRIRGSR